jgi:hypothetical protein
MHKKICIWNCENNKEFDSLFCRGHVGFPHVPGPAGKIIQVFACRRMLLIREQTQSAGIFR